MSASTVQSKCVCVCRHSGVELSRIGLFGKDEAEGSDMASVVTPIFFSERSSVTEMERENTGRDAAGASESKKELMDQNVALLFFFVITVFPLNFLITTQMFFVRRACWAH